ncbi:MAG: hypothetical protein GXP15_15240 [Gammaproteobacteria bacterium]|nr:hypothetical protein [Gammaproteobacteria bacterium]
MLRTGSCVILVSWLAACSTSDLRTDVPALLTNPSEDTRLEIEQSVSAALDGAKITVAADALTQSSVLTIEQGKNRSIERPAEPGRNLGRPEHFQLMVDGPQCVLVHRRTGLHWILRQSECVAE